MAKKVTWQSVHLTLGSEVAMQCSILVRIKTLPHSQKRVNAFLVISYGLQKHIQAKLYIMVRCIM